MAFTPQQALQRAIEHREIFFDEMVDLMRQVMRGEVSPVMTAAILTGLRVKKETVGEIAGADDVHQVRLVRHLHRQRKLAHHRGRAGNFADSFLLHPQPGEDGGGHHRRHVTAHDLAHQPDHFVVEDLAVFDRTLQGFLGGDGHGRGAMDWGLASLARRACPQTTTAPKRGRRFHPGNRAGFSA